MSRTSRTSVEEKTTSPNVSDIEKSASGETPVLETVENAVPTSSDEGAHPETKVSLVILNEERRWNIMI